MVNSYYGGAPMPRYFFVMFFVPLLLCSQSTDHAEIKPCDEGEVYNVYSAVLEKEKTKSGIVIGDTTVPFNSCLDSRSDKLVDSAIEDYKKMNKDRWNLGYHFESNRPYKLISRKEADELLQPNKRTGAWRLSPSNGIHHFSAVGFSADKSVAFVEMDVVCGGLCGHGSPFILQKKKGKWVQYSPGLPATENSDGIWTSRTITICSWNY